MTKRDCLAALMDKETLYDGRYTFSQIAAMRIKAGSPGIRRTKGFKSVGSLKHVSEVKPWHG